MHAHHSLSLSLSQPRLTLRDLGSLPLISLAYYEAIISLTIRLLLAYLKLLSALQSTASYLLFRKALLQLENLLGQQLVLGRNLTV